MAGRKRSASHRAHLEEDAGKNIHTLGNFSAVDLNRAGTPLLEIVTEPDMNSPAEVRALAQELQRIVRFLGVSEGDMQKGHMRFEPNVNLHIERGGQICKTPITEVKNLNSFRALERSIAYEAARQYEEFLETGKTLQMGNKKTFGWDDVNEVTVLQREKEEAHDYRYFPEPDLVPVEVGPEWLAEIRDRMCELPLAMQNRFVTQCGLSDYDAGVLTGDRATAEFFDATVKLGADPKRVCNLLTQVGLKIANEAGVTVDRLKITPENLAKLAQMADGGTISATAANTLFEQIAKDGGDPASAAKEQNLIQSSDSGEIEALVDAVIAESAAGGAGCGAGKQEGKKGPGLPDGPGHPEIRRPGQSQSRLPDPQPKTRRPQTKFIARLFSTFILASPTGEEGYGEFKSIQHWYQESTPGTRRPAEYAASPIAAGSGQIPSRHAAAR